KKFQTNAIIYQDVSNDIVGAEPQLQEVKRAEIIVNDALKIDDLSLYQDSYQQNEFQSMSFKLHQTNDEDEESIAEFTVDLTNPENEYTFENGYSVELSYYFTDYVLEDG